MVTWFPRAGVFFLALALSGCGGGGSEAPGHEAGWICLDGGCFRMGDDRVFPEETPVHEACVTPFSIMTHEVTVAQFAAFVADTGYVTRAERGWRADETGGPGVDLPPGSAIFQSPAGAVRDLDWWRYEAGVHWQDLDGKGTTPGKDEPVVHLTPADAAAYAAWAGGRLPTEAEWEYAARGGLEGSLYAWDEAEEAAIEGRANTWQGIFPVINSAADGYSGVAPVGSFPPNGFGLYDMIGNVWEMTSTPYAPHHDLTGDADGAASDGVAIKGGSFLCAPNYCFRFRPAARQAQDRVFGTSHVGFRVVKDAA